MWVAKAVCQCLPGREQLLGSSTVDSCTKGLMDLVYHKRPLLLLNIYSAATELRKQHRGTWCTFSSKQ
jgi:hypothetical protein